MTDLDTPPGERRTQPIRSSLRKPLGLAAGIGTGFLLWVIIALTTQNLALGIVFGFLPGVAIGFGLQWTARR